MTRWQVGDLIDSRWEVVRVLQGGMGNVYLVFDRASASPVALKVGRPDREACPDAARRFEEEARVWLELGAHENVVALDFIHSAEGTILLGLEYVTGGSLSEWLADRPHVADIPTVLRLALNICDGMVHANAAGLLVHRDLKPANCLLTADGVGKVTDFGLAKLRTGRFEAGAVTPTATSATHAGAVLGTPAYMAPEQFVAARDVDCRADIYSFGVMLMEMLTGRLPYAASDPIAYYRLHAEARIPSLRDYFHPKTNIGSLDLFIRMCLAKSPVERFATFRDVRNELAAIYERVTGQSPPAPAESRALDVRRLSNKVGGLNELRRYDEALAVSDMGMALDAEHSNLWNNRGSAFVGLQRSDEAQKCFRRALALSESNALAWANLGVLLRREGRVREALEAYDTSLRIDPTNVRTLTNKAATLLAGERWSDALTVLDSALRHNARFPDALFNKAFALCRLERHEEALGACNGALALRPYDADTLHLHEEIVLSASAQLFQEQRFESAACILRDAVQRHADSVRLLVNFGFTELARGRYREAASALDRALHLDSHNPRAHLGKAELRHH
jgi:serine/threonine protein kinase/cytochrome c-type biogenesis protein CcmH/NrfG